MPPFHQEADGYAACIQGTHDDLGTFGNKHTLGRLEAVEQLRLRQAGVDIQPGIIKAVYFNNVCPPKEKSNE